jgi:hypothetical protein
VVIVDVFGHFAREKSLDGIMANFRIVCGGNAHATGVVRSSSVDGSLGAQAERHSWSVLQRSRFSSGLSSDVADRLPRRQPNLSAGAALSRERNARGFFYSELFQMRPTGLSVSRF